MQIHAGYLLEDVSQDTSFDCCASCYWYDYPVVCEQCIAIHEKTRLNVAHPAESRHSISTISESMLWCFVTAITSTQAVESQDSSDLGKIYLLNVRQQHVSVLLLQFMCSAGVHICTFMGAYRRPPTI